MVLARLLCQKLVAPQVQLHILTMKMRKASEDLTMVLKYAYMNMA